MATKLSGEAKKIVDFSRAAYEAQPWLLKAQEEYAGRFGAAEAQSAGARSSSEAGQVASRYPAYYQALMDASPEYAAAADGFQTQAAGANRMYALLNQQAGDDLELGGALNADQQREASQGARAAWSARGMGSSGRSAIDEVLNRVAMSDQRKQQRQATAMQVAAGGAAVASQNMNTASANFDPYARLFGKGGSQATGTLNSDGIFQPYAQTGSQLYSTNKNYDAAMAQIASQESMFKQGQKFDRWATLFNADQAKNIAGMNMQAAKDAGQSSMWGSAIGGIGSILGGALSNPAIGTALIGAI